MPMKNWFCPAITLLMALLCSQGFAQVGTTTGVQATQPTPIITVSPWRPSGIPPGYRAPTPTAILDKGSRLKSKPLPPEWANRYDPDSEVMDGEVLASGRLQGTQAADVQRSFVANESGPLGPMDNTMAISDSGYIVSADNTTIEFYKDDPDTLVQYQLHSDFYADTTIGIRGFDPKVIYDRWHRRFILVLLLDQDYQDNQMILSFSKHEDPRRGWNHYYLNTDTLSADQWFDFPMIALNREELFIAGNMASDGADEVVGNKIYQIRLQEGYDSLQLRFRIWADVLDSDGAMASFLCPLSHALQDSAYNQGMHFVSTKYLNTLPIPLDSTLFRYRITDNLSNPQATILSFKTTTVPYNKPNDGLQLNGPDPIQVGDCRVLSGFYLNDKLYFVYVKSSNGFAVIALNIWDINTNTLERHPWGFSSAQYHYCYPSIAFYGADTQDENQIIMCFQRTGATIYPELLAVHFDSGFVHSSILVKQGQGYVNLNGINSIDRWGDYTGIQRRYGAPFAACWLVGSYASGPVPNYFGEIHALNAFVAEISDSLINSVEMPQPLSQYRTLIYPNPTEHGIFSASFSEKARPVRWSVFDLKGILLHNEDFRYGRPDQIDLSDKPAGVYFVNIQFIGGGYETHRLVRN